MTPTPLERIARLRILPVIVIDSADHAVPLARALADGGLAAVEVTFRTAAARDAIRRIVVECPDVLVGAGTVLSPEQVDAARDAGATFLVAPGLNPNVVRCAQDAGLPIYPGIATPSEIEQAMELGLDVVKFFPAEPMGGITFLKAIAAPYLSMRFMPTGGITAENIAPYLAFDRVVACGGSWMAPADRIRAGDFAWIRSEADKAARLVPARDGAKR